MVSGLIKRGSRIQMQFQRLSVNMALQLKLEPIFLTSVLFRRDVDFHPSSCQFQCQPQMNEALETK